ncbi:hypothetical protein [Neobacillus sp. SuZ13]|uniref:hypothetical protein n=1 Tax=Neobacillus sp. SuZ13 TaxID=3047875 RepID=UPI0024BF8B29|nr:hypothetical protein [Neobacillus sp. SuZ13]WHY67702.1 hypothetical protein QNH17_03350 [Neobacillus sp. SuZ13]
MNSVETVLTEEMKEMLQGQTIVFCNVYHPQVGKVLSSALSWVFAIDNNTIRFAVDSKSKILDIVRNHGDVILSFFASESVYSVSGPSSLVVEKADKMTLKMAIIEVDVKEVRNITFYGAQITQEPRFIKTYKESLIKKLDNEVKEAVFSY